MEGNALNTTVSYRVVLQWSETKVRWFGKSTNFRCCRVLDGSPRSEGVRTSYLARLGFRDDIFEKRFLGVFPRKISHLWWPSRPEIWRKSRKSPKIRIFRRPRTIFSPNRWKKIENQKFLTTSTKYAYEPQAYQKWGRSVHWRRLQPDPPEVRRFSTEVRWFPLVS